VSDADDEMDEFYEECPAVQFCIFQEMLEQRFPDYDFIADEPEAGDENGKFFMDVRKKTPLLMVIEFQKDKGWGISRIKDDSAFDGTRDIVTGSPNAALELTTAMLTSIIKG